MQIVESGDAIIRMEKLPKVLLMLKTHTIKTLARKGSQ